MHVATYFQVPIFVGCGEHSNHETIDVVTVYQLVDMIFISCSYASTLPFCVHLQLVKDAVHCCYTCQTKIIQMRLYIAQPRISLHVN